MLACYIHAVVFLYRNFDASISVGANVSIKFQPENSLSECLLITTIMYNRIYIYNDTCVFGVYLYTSRNHLINTCSLLLCEAKLIAPKHVRVVCLVFVYVFH